MLYFTILFHENDIWIGYHSVYTPLDTEHHFFISAYSGGEMICFSEDVDNIAAYFLNAQYQFAREYLYEKY